MTTYNQMTMPNITNLNRLVRRDFDVVFGIGFLMEDAIETIADTTYRYKLAIIDEELMLPNVASIMFKEQEGAFLAGVAAALMSNLIKSVLLVEWKFQ